VTPRWFLKRAQSCAYLSFTKLSIFQLMPSHQVHDEHSWRLSRITQLWAELRTTRAATPHYYELVDRIRREAEAYTRAGHVSIQYPEGRVASGHG
jgi:hypothetical protein